MRIYAAKTEMDEAISAIHKAKMAIISYESRPLESRLEKVVFELGLAIGKLSSAANHLGVTSTVSPGNPSESRADAQIPEAEELKRNG